MSVFTPIKNKQIKTEIQSDQADTKPAEPVTTPTQPEAK